MDGPVRPRASTALRPVPLDALRLDPAGLLGGWQRRNAAATLPHCIEQLDRSGALDNLRRSGDRERPHEGMWFSDSDVYKTLEAAAWQLVSQPDAPELVSFIEATGRLLASVQDGAGYLNSYFQQGPPERRWQDMRDGHELYCAGHLIQAAVAAGRAGVGDALVPLAVRVADMLVDRFAAGGTDAVCGHPEIETALVELFRFTGRRAYLDLAARFVDLRGNGLLGPGRFGSAYYLDHLPVRQATEFTGHAVRQVYLLAGVVDVATETGDAALLAAAERLWESAFGSKTYLTGAHGSRHRDEAVGDPYELPPDRAYAETCAAIGSFQWNWRMLLATGAVRYADEMERVLYNAIGGSTALDGRHFFYANPLHLRTDHNATEDAPSQRLPWYDCACCPPNLARLMASLQGYLATADDTGMQLHLYAAGTVHTPHATVRVDTQYPWHDRVDLTVESHSSRPWTLALRVPGWCAGATVRVDGADIQQRATDGYLRLTRDWRGTTRLTLTLPMPVQVLAAHPRVDAVRGCVALRRGPLVYCLEQADLPSSLVLEDVAIDPTVPVDTVVHGTTAPVPVTLQAHAVAHRGEDRDLYHDYPGTPVEPTPLRLTAVPYFLWGNRTPGPMRVWLPTVIESTPRKEHQ